MDPFRIRGDPQGPNPIGRNPSEFERGPRGLGGGGSWVHGPEDTWAETQMLAPPGPLDPGPSASGRLVAAPLRLFG